MNGGTLRALRAQPDPAAGDRTERPHRLAARTRDRSAAPARRHRGARRPPRHGGRRDADRRRTRGRARARACGAGRRYHPSWKQDVASVLVSSGDDVVLVDPLAPRDDAAPAFWQALDEAADAGRRLTVVVTVPDHARSAPAIVVAVPRRRRSTSRCRRARRSLAGVDDRRRSRSRHRSRPACARTRPAAPTSARSGSHRTGRSWSATCCSAPRRRARVCPAGWLPKRRHPRGRGGGVRAAARARHRARRPHPRRPAGRVAGGRWRRPLAEARVIARTWRGETAAARRRRLRRLPGDDRPAGLPRHAGQPRRVPAAARARQTTEFVTLTFWDDLDAVRRVRGRRHHGGRLLPGTTAS